MLQRASLMVHDDSLPLDDEWNARLDIPTDRMFAASTHLIFVGEETIGQHTLHAAEAFTVLSGMLDHIPGVTQHARNDPDSGLSLRLTGVYKPPRNTAEDAAGAEDAAVEARFSAQVLLQSTYSSCAELQVLLQLLPLAADNRYEDSNEKLAARGRAIEALAAELHSRFLTRRKMNGGRQPITASSMAAAAPLLKLPRALQGAAGGRDGAGLGSAAGASVGGGLGGGGELVAKGPLRGILKRPADAIANARPPSPLSTDRV